MTSDASAAPTMLPADGVRILLCTVSPAKARKVAGTLVEEGLAACVNLVPGLRSIYRWKGDILDEPETLLIIKTTAEHVPSLAARLPGLHPYEVPELLALNPSAGLSPYLAWLHAQVAPPATNE